MQSLGAWQSLCHCVEIIVYVPAEFMRGLSMPTMMCTHTHTHTFICKHPSKSVSAPQSFRNMPAFTDTVQGHKSQGLICQSRDNTNFAGGPQRPARDRSKEQRLNHVLTDSGHQILSVEQHSGGDLRKNLVLGFYQLVWPKLGFEQSKWPEN